MMDALALIRSFEGFRDTPYWDMNALRTGYGSSTVTLPDGSVQRVTEGTRVSREDADRDLARRVQSEFLPRAAKAVGEEAFSKLSGAQQAALASITYNYGSLPSGVAQAAASGDMAATTAAIRALASHNDGVNAKRRNKEADIFSGANAPDMRQEAPADYSRLAYAYANGKMTSEDEAIYERGMGDGTFPNAKKSAPQQQMPDPLAIYAQQMQSRQRQAPQLQPLQFAQVQNATPLQKYPGL